MSDAMVSGGRRRVVAWSAAGVLAAYLLGAAWWTTERVEDHLSGSARKALDAAGLRNVPVRYDGRSAVVRVGGGTAQAAQARRVVEAVEGTTDVTIEGVDAAALPAPASSAGGGGPTATPVPTPVPTPGSGGATTTPGPAQTAPTGPPGAGTTPGPAQTAVRSGTSTVTRSGVVSPSGASVGTVVTEATAPGAPGAGMSLRFVSDGVTVEDAHAGVLALVTAYLVEHPDRQVFITGHSDASDSVEEDEARSRARALAVRTALRRLGIPYSRMRVDWYGSRRPLASNATAAGRAANRRVEFVFEEA